MRPRAFGHEQPPRGRVRLVVDLSIVTTLYQSAPYVHEAHRRLSAAAHALVSSFEIIFVNDGSPDDALAKVMKLHEQDARVKVIDLARNFGHHKAMMTGLAHATGDRIFLIDSDLEEEPELLARFMAEMEASGSDVV